MIYLTQIKASMRKCILIILFSVLSSISYGQIKSDSGFHYLKSIQLEVGGHGLLYSFVYERFIVNGTVFKTSSQLGLSAFPLSNQIFLLAPLSINELFSFSAHHLEIGLGFIPVKAGNISNGKIYYWNTHYWYSFKMGYRYQKPDSKFLFRIDFTPIKEMNLSSKDIFLSGGIAVGYCF